MRHPTRTLVTASLIAFGLAASASAQHPSGGQPTKAAHPSTVPPAKTTQHPTGVHPGTPAGGKTGTGGTNHHAAVPTSPTQSNPKHSAGAGIVQQSKHPAVVKGIGGVEVKTANYAATHGLKTKGGNVVYKGQEHQHWTRRHYSTAWRCWCWYDPCTGGWYYWCGANGYYQPVQCLTTAAPSQTDADAAAGDLPPDGSSVPVASSNEIPDLPGVP